MKLKITKGANYDKVLEAKKCLACNGSGWYDSYDFKRNRPIPCGSCNNTGWADPEDQKTLPSRA